MGYQEDDRLNSFLYLAQDGDRMEMKHYVYFPEKGKMGKVSGAKTSVNQMKTIMGLAYDYANTIHEDDKAELPIQHIVTVTVRGGLVEEPTTITLIGKEQWVPFEVGYEYWFGMEDDLVDQNVVKF